MTEALCIGTRVVSGAFEPEGLPISEQMESLGSEIVGSGSEVEATEIQLGDSISFSAKREGSFRAEIDTSAPFESVKEAVSRFGGIGYWKPSHNKPSDTAIDDTGEIDMEKLKEQTRSVEKDLILKEREALEVLKELESTKMIIAELKSKLQNETLEVSLSFETNTDFRNLTTSAVEEADKENHSHLRVQSYNSVNSLSSLPSSTPGLILLELKQAKLNLTRTTTDIADIRTSVDAFNKKLDKERISLEKTRERLTQSSSKVSYLEEELNQTRQKLQIRRDADANGFSDDPLNVSKDLQRLNFEVEQFKKIGEDAKLEVSRTISEIENTKAKIKTAEMRLVAARKMKEAARAAEAVALTEFKVLSNHHERSSEHSSQTTGDVTLSHEEYTSLIHKAREADEISRKRVIEAMEHVDEANESKVNILKRVEEATEEVQTSKKALEAALNRVEAANKGKLAVEEALRRWRSDHGHKRRHLHNSTKFKTPGPANQRRESILRDVNGLNLISDGCGPVLKPTLSIGQILSRKLLSPEDFDPVMHVDKTYKTCKMSLGQMLSRQDIDQSPVSNKAEKDPDPKQFIGKKKKKKKKLGFSRISRLLLAKQMKKKKPNSHKK